MTVNRVLHWTRRTFLSVSTAAAASVCLRAEEGTFGSMVLIGCTSKDIHDGIHAAQWSAAQGSLSDLRVAFEAVSPGFFAISKRSRLLFAGYRQENSMGALSALRIGANGHLELLNTITVPHFDFVHVMLDHTERCIVAASYGSGMVISCRVEANGHIGDVVSRLQLTGHGPNPTRQTSPHAHGVAFSPDNRFALINDLGTDRIMVYRLDAATATLTPNDPPFFAAAPGSGPRHTKFHPNGRWAYSINEMGSTITQLAWAPKTGTLTLVSTTPTLPADASAEVRANNRAGELLFDPNGRFLYGCNRGGREEMLTYAVGSDGHLTLLGRTPLEGKEARHFTLSPDGRYLLVAKQFSNEVAVYARDLKTGLLRATGSHVTVSKPSCVLFA